MSEEADMTQGQFVRLIVWAFILTLIALGLVIDHKTNGPHLRPKPQVSEAIVMPKASSPT